MKKFTIQFSVLMVLSVMTLEAQNLKFILRKHFDSVGQDIINRADAVIVKGKISQMGMEIPYILYQKRPGKVKFVATYQEMQLVQSFDGKNGWVINPANSPEPTEMGSSEKKTMQSLAEMEGRLYNWRKKKYKVSLEGIDLSEGSGAYKIKVITPGEITELFYINKDTYLITRIDSKEKEEGIIVESTKKLSDYRSINGYQVAFRTETTIMGEYSGDIILSSYEFKNANEVPDSIFVKPN